MTKSADLHIHTNFSDSSSSPREVVLKAVKAGLACIAVTDHDTVDGVQPAVEASDEFDCEVIPGVELSTEVHNKDVHILGYLMDPLNTHFLERLSCFQNTRVERMRKMLERLKGEGIDNISLEEVCCLAQSDSVGRPHLATLLIEKGWVADTREAFARYLGEGCSAYEPKFKQSPQEAIELICQSGGVAVLAHPMASNIDELIPELIKAGLGGIEVYYPHCTKNIIQYYEGISRKHDLVMTGGSDDHGDTKKDSRIGTPRIPYQLVEQLKDRCS